jgi:hypothetical protein
MAGLIVFRKSLAYENILLRRQVISYTSEICTICSAGCSIGEVDVIYESWFECQECTNRRCSGVLGFQFVVEKHFDATEHLVDIAVRKGYLVPDELWYWFGSRWWDKFNKSMAWLQPAFVRKGFNFYLVVRTKALQSINMLCLCLMRLAIYKDLRQFIVQLIWHPRTIISWLK